VKKVFLLYKNAYGGLSQSAWILSVIMLINRSGSMVVPFLAVYLTTELKFSVEQAGIIMAVFGLGSMVGSYMGGFLTDKFGQFWVQFLSLSLGGLMFIILGQISLFVLLAAWMFLLSVVTDSLRPANAASISLYAKPENITRAFSLNRMAVNLGYSIGPAVGGLLAAVSYSLLFYVDGFTCIVAGFIFFFFFRNKKTNVAHKDIIQEEELTPKGKTAFQDVRYILFAICCVMFAMTFFQLFVTLPLYYRDVYNMHETNIGLLIGLNGLMVFLFEMVIVYLIGQKLAKSKLIIAGTLLAGLSFSLLNLFEGGWVLYLAMIALSFGEIFAMPFMVTYTVERSGPRTRGSYMGMYALSYSTAFVIAPFIGTKIISNYGYMPLWYGAGALSILTAAGFYLTMREEKQPHPVKIPVESH
jgi:predicted MFS family arabinose efflux permease